ncbi:hypothetical protein B0A48_17279 [Cryoendolithus antarcticus]|uniref:Uncharacterized protein n=1 Tax=Cryoendolithus antarcticus TaxID=1507870 RepID=A0A1V8SC52_9PEZI|nr:hypothetical protein B0A48_17279 [Cryoendolithus antarcticus]
MSNHKLTIPSRLRFSILSEDLPNTTLKREVASSNGIMQSEPTDDFFSTYPNMHVGAPPTQPSLGLLPSTDDESLYIARHNLDPDQCIRLWKALGADVPLTTIPDPHAFLATLPAEPRLFNGEIVQELEEISRQALQVDALSTLGSHGILNERASPIWLPYGTYLEGRPPIIYAQPDQPDHDILPYTTLPATSTPRTLNEAITHLALLHSVHLPPEVIIQVFDGLNVALQLLRWKTQQFSYEGVFHHPATSRHEALDEHYAGWAQRKLEHVGSTCAFLKEFWACVPSLEQLEGVEWEGIGELRWRVGMAKMEREEKGDEWCDVCTGRVGSVVLGEAQEDDEDGEKKVEVVVRLPPKVG